VLGWSGEGGIRFSRREVAEKVGAAAEQFGIHVDPRAFVWQLSVGERQRVEILKALYRGARTLILDEPTTVLTPGEIETLFASLRRMAEAGGTVVFISHKLRELFAVADRVTVLRRGRTVGTVDLDGSADETLLARMMVDRDVQLERRLRRPAGRSGAPVLQLREVTAKSDFGTLALDNVSLEIRAGEILGVAGVAGNGQRELAEVIAGVRRRTGGSVLLGDEELPNGEPRAAIAQGLAYVPEDRFGIGLAPGLELRDNIVLKSYRTPAYSRGPFVLSKSVLTASQALLQRFDVKGGPETLVRQLSGGNAQKVLLARELSSNPTVLVIAEPSAGLDFAATEAIRRYIVEAADAGVSVLLISGDLEEILTLADRIVVMYGGSIVGVIDAATADVEQVGRLMAGVLS
jgi:general nucleoside transport system ATP-binding protein